MLLSIARVCSRRMAIVRCWVGMSGCTALTRPLYLHVALNVAHLGSLFMLSTAVDRLIAALACVCILRGRVVRAAIVAVVVAHMHTLISLLTALGTVRWMCTRHTLYLTCG